MEFKEFYSVEEAQELLNVNRDTVYRYLKKGIIESIKLGKEHRITGESLKKALTPKKR